MTVAWQQTRKGKKEEGEKLLFLALAHEVAGRKLTREGERRSRKRKEGLNERTTERHTHTYRNYSVLY